MRYLADSNLKITTHMKDLLIAALLCIGVQGIAQNVRIDLKHGGAMGGQLDVYDEAQRSIFTVQPDEAGNGAYVAIRSGRNAFDFLWDGDFFNSSGLFQLAGNGSSTQIRTYNIGDEAVILPGNAISAAEINDEAGITHKLNSGSVAVGGVTTTIASTVIVAPTDGYVIVMAHSEIELDHTSGIESSVNIGVSEAQGTLSGVQDILLAVPSGAASGDYSMPGAAHGVYEVTAGANSFYLLGKKLSGSITARDSKVTALFIPTSYGTVENEIDAPTEDQLSLTSDGLTPAQISQAEKASLLANQERMQREIDELKALLLDTASSSQNNPR